MPGAGPRPVILGAGLAGLSAAYHMCEPYDIFEANASAGGVARSLTCAGFTFDHAIHVLFSSDPYASRLIRALLGDDFAEHERSAWIYSNDVYTRYPYQANLHGLPSAIIRENLLGLIMARFGPKTGPIRNFEDWTRTMFGDGIAKNFMLPFNRKVWATEPREMGFDWIDGRVMLPDIDQIFVGAFRTSNFKHGPNAVFWYPRRGGTAALYRAFQARINHVSLLMRCVAIDPNTRTVWFENGKTCKYSSLISTMPLPTLISRMDHVPARIHLLASQLRANRVITVNLGIDRENISDKHWVYFPEAEFEFHRISFPASFAKSLVPNGTSSIMIEFSESDTRPIERKRLIERTIRQLRRIRVIDKHDTILHRSITEIDPAYIIQGIDHGSIVGEIQEYLRSLGIISCGRFGEWAYLNMDQAILSGKHAAEDAMGGCVTKPTFNIPEIARA
ncbi:MAG: FAD-dependent oxidoreductase [Bacteroidota bacterium]|nr:FAD-dependent oxidoreductase [Bacteroidota bacterium]MDP4234463.1 FAD-dependent oxidoreductase [Bacteroidota bacterium]MDP4243955.1 FAD-dependent oxidoreductase [Bacteroidota bacterium]MDP4288195.1 FAD-dependent oxidoreductase [Bacteroidota bacterium]